MLPSAQNSSILDTCRAKWVLFFTSGFMSMQQYDGGVNQKHIPLIFRVFFALIQQICHGDKLLGIYWL